MKKNILLFFACFTASSVTCNQIKHIFVDISAIISTSTMAAAKHVGMINSIRYSAVVGHTPTKSDFFHALQDVTAISQDQTYNDNLLMPCIFSDWLLGIKNNKQIKTVIYQHLDNSDLSNIEVTIFKNIANMMMTPASLIETQHVVKDITKILFNLKKAGYKIYLIGNWDKESEPLLMKLLQGYHLPEAHLCYFSSKAKKLKPTSDYFKETCSHFHTIPKETLIIDTEKHHALAARHAGIQTILLHNHNPSQLKTELARIGIKL
jgi:FMN phosphatase YigB (HAD superfamily)